MNFSIKSILFTVWKLKFLWAKYSSSLCFIPTRSLTLNPFCDRRGFFHWLSTDWIRARNFMKSSPSKSFILEICWQILIQSRSSFLPSSMKSTCSYFCCFITGNWSAFSCLGEESFWCWIGLNLLTFDILLKDLTGCYSHWGRCASEFTFKWLSWTQKLSPKNPGRGDFSSFRKNSLPLTWAMFLLGFCFTTQS